MSKINYPPEEIYNPPVMEKKNFEHIILWMLYNNDECEWANFTEKPLELRLSTLSKYLSLLKGKHYVENISRGHYKITPEGKKRYLDLSSVTEEKRKLSYPPAILRRRRNYNHWILWMVYNNNHCKWADFISEPLSINQSSLSKNLNLLQDQGFVKKEEKEYRITRAGKAEYSTILRDYNLDRQSILDEESKRIEEVTKNTIQFFEKFVIDDEELQFRFLNNVLKLDYSRVESMLTDEEEFEKILFFISINHPDRYPEFVSITDFSKKYRINETKLEYYVDEIIENNIYPIKFFKLSVSPNSNYFFQENEKLELMLRAIAEDHITKFTYLNKLFSRTVDIKNKMEDILNDVCEALFDKKLKSSLREFLPDYIKYLAYKIEAKVELKETLDKLEGIIWQDMADIFQAQTVEGVRGQFVQDLEEIANQIKSDPDNIDLYYSKIKILIYYEEYNEILITLDEMSDLFPESEKEIKIRRASVLRRMQDIEAGLDIIEELIQEYPDDPDLLNYKAYWLQYLDKEEESLSVIQDLVKSFPENGTYHDTYGEILMYFENYEKASEHFLEAINLAGDEWYIHQTYIKLGICYKELKNYDLAVENLERGIAITEEEVEDMETKQKWLSVGNLFLAEIEQLA
ncbi:MAG: tetratricopeptide repeat protein [Candidatus Thorarchaeota archaeon]